MSANIMVLEDERILKDDLVEFLMDCGYNVSGYSTAKEFNMDFQSFKPNVVLLDINLPDADGYTIAEQIRRQSPSTGIIMLTCRSALEDKLHGYNSGADTYLVKHTELKEIDAAIKSLLRRLSRDEIRQDSQSGYWTLDHVNWTVTSPNGKSVLLTSSELALLSTLFSKPGATFSRDVLCQNMDRPIKDEPDRGIDAIVKRLRQKFQKATGDELPIAIVYGVGYAFTGRVKVER